MISTYLHCSPVILLLLLSSYVMLDEVIVHAVLNIYPIEVIAAIIFNVFAIEFITATTLYVNAYISQVSEVILGTISYTPSIQ